MEQVFEDGDFPANLAPLPALPTRAAPGSEEKIRVMAERYARREQLTHPCDARCTGDAVPVEFERGDHAHRAEMLALYGAKPTGFSMFFQNPANSG